MKRKLAWILSAAMLLSTPASALAEEFDFSSGQENSVYMEETQESELFSDGVLSDSSDTQSLLQDPEEEIPEETLEESAEETAEEIFSSGDEELLSTPAIDAEITGNTAIALADNSKTQYYFKITLPEKTVINLYTTGGTSASGKLYDKDMKLIDTQSECANGYHLYDYELDGNTDYYLELDIKERTGAAESLVLEYAGTDESTQTLANGINLFSVKANTPSRFVADFKTEGTFLLHFSASDNISAYVEMSDDYTIYKSGSSFDVIAKFTSEESDWITISTASSADVTGTLKVTSLTSIASLAENNSAASKTWDDQGCYEWFEFTPEKTGVYSIYLDSDVSLNGALYDSGMQLLASDQTNGIGNSFKICCSLTAKKTYYLNVSGGSSKGYKVIANYADYTGLDLDSVTGSGKIAAESQSFEIAAGTQFCGFKYSPAESGTYTFDLSQTAAASFKLLNDMLIETGSMSDSSTIVANLEAGKDYYIYYNNVEKSQNTVTILTQKRDADKNLEKASITLDTMTYTYTGTACTPKVQVLFNNTELMQDVDYIFSYSDNVEPGMASLTIKGINKYYGSLTKQFKINCQIPEVTAESNSDGILVKWTAPHGAVNYRVYRKPDSKTASWSKIGDTTSTSFTDKTAASNNTYVYTVRCISEDGTTILSGYKASESLFYIAAPIPVITVGADYLKITWKESAGAAGYRVFKKAAGDTKWKKVTDTNQLTYTDKDVESGKTYTYTIRCLSDSGKYIGTYDTKGVSSLFLSAPVMKSAVNGNGYVLVKWEAVKGAEKYRLYRKANGETKWTAVKNTAAVSLKDSSVTSGKTYTYVVRCITSDGKAFTSYFNTTGISVNYIAAPVLKSIAAGPESVKLNWAASAGAQNYRVYRKASGEKKWTVLGDTQAISYEDKNVTGGKTYRYTVRCISSDGTVYTSSYNAAGIKITYVAAPVISTIYNSAKGIGISWKAVEGASKYRVFRKADGAAKWTAVADTEKTVYDDTSAENGKFYTYTVRALSSEGKAVSGYLDGKSYLCLSKSSLTAKNSAAGEISLSWTTNMVATGYTVQIALNNNFVGRTSKTITSSTEKSYVISSLSDVSKYYYARIRSYKTYNGVTYYSAWTVTNKFMVK